MDLKQQILDGLKLVLLENFKKDIDSGKLVSPIDFETKLDDVWKRLRLNPQTAGAIMLFRLKQEDIGKLLREVFTELGVEVK